MTPRPHTAPSGVGTDAKFLDEWDALVRRDRLRSIKEITAAIRYVEGLPRRDVLRPLTDEEYQALRASIAKRGVQVAVQLDAATGEILDGFHRLRISAELGLPKPEIALRDLATDEDRTEHAVMLNLLHRDLDPVTKGEALEALAKARGVRVGSGKGDPSGKAATVAALADDLGVSERTARSWREAAALPEEEKEKVRSRKLTVRQAKAAFERRRKRDNPSTDPLPLPAGTFNVVLADPPWRYGFATENRKVENHYPTESIEALTAFGAHGSELRERLAPDAMLFLWVTTLEEEALALMRAWDFAKVSEAVWVKDSIGQGYYWRQQHERLLLGRRGKGLGTPPEHARRSSVIYAGRREHSRKPEQAYEHIEAMYPQGTFLELFSRSARSGWAHWGLDAPLGGDDPLQPGERAA